MKKTKKSKTRIKLIDIKKIRFSPEIEVELPSEKDRKALLDKKRTMKGWEIKEDYSLQNGIELSPMNSNKLYWNNESLIQIKEILAFIRVHRGFINPKTCGLHIHIDAKWLTDKQVHTIITEWVHKQRFVVKRFKIHQNRLKETCQLLPTKEIKKLKISDIKKARSNNRYGFDSYSYLDEKYYSLNVNHLSKEDYQTLEFRLFGGTLKFKEIKSAIYFCLNFIKDSCERE